MTNATKDQSAHTEAQSQVMRLLVARGYVNQCTNFEGLDIALMKTGVLVYVGFDATADSLHVGHLLPIMTLRWLQKHGHKPVILVGGGTTRIGDPSFRTEARPMLDDQQIARNIEGIKKVFNQFLTFGDGPTDAVLVNNADWLDELKYIDVLRDVGRHFSVNRMLSFESVRSRLERQENLSFLEFNYMILQAYDFLELFRRTGVRVQMGGADQWANIINGIDLVRRTVGAEVFGMTAPLLTTASGTKMGKTAAGAVWLNADRLSPFDYWQFWRNVEDADVGKFLRLFTDLDMEEIQDLDALYGAELNRAKIRLANEATRLAHGSDAALAAEETAQATFSRAHGDPSKLPSIAISVPDLEEAISIVDVLVTGGLSPSKGEAKRLIQGRGLRVDGVTIENDKASLRPAMLVENKVRISVGRKRHVIVEIKKANSTWNRDA